MHIDNILHKFWQEKINADSSYRTLNEIAANLPKELQDIQKVYNFGKYGAYVMIIYRTKDSAAAFELLDIINQHSNYVPTFLCNNKSIVPTKNQAELTAYYIDGIGASYYSVEPVAGYIKPLNYKDESGREFIDFEYFYEVYRKIAGYLVEFKAIVDEPDFDHFKEKRHFQGNYTTCFNYF